MVEHIETPEGFNEFQDKSYRFELAVNEEAKAFVFYNKPLENKLSWLEFDLGTNKLDFVMEDGDLRDFGMPVHPDLAKHMQNAHQVFMVQIDEESGDALEGEYFPLILHKE